MATQEKKKLMNRRTFLKESSAALGLAATAPLVGSLGFPSRSHAAETVKVFMFGHTYPRGFKKYFSEFEKKTGMAVEIETPSFPIYNQRADLELAGATGAYDVMTMTFIYTGKWMGAGWSTKLNAFLEDPKLTSKADFDPDDFLAGAVAPLKIGDTVYAIPFVAESTLMVYRTDILEKFGYSKPPDTFDELMEMAAKINTKECAAYVGRGQPHSFHWVFPNFLHAYGGDFFADPPKDMTPILDSEEAIKAAEVFVKLHRDYAVPGVVNFMEDDSRLAMQQGRGAMWIDALAWVGTAGDKKNSRVADRVAYALPPKGPKGRFPQSAVHGLQIPASAKRKEISWEFIKWAISKEMMSRISNEFAYPAVTRASVVDSPAYKEKYNWGGSDIGALHKQVLELAGTGYMTYRTVPVFPPVGDRLGIALIEACTNQKSVRKAMQDCNRDVAGILKKAGYKISKS